MSDEDEDIIESENDATEEVENTEEVEETVEDTVTEDTKPEYTEFEKKQFKRAKEAEAELKAAKQKIADLEKAKAPPEKQDGISAMDAMALMGAKVTEEEDINEVVDYAKFKGISVSEALKATAIKSILAEKAEQRTTAEATNTSNARRGTTKPSAETILTNASKGKLPENPEDLADAWIESKKKK